MQIIGFPYKGSRAAYHVYHPAKHGPHTMEGQWERAAKEFSTKLTDFISVCELYTDQQSLSERVGGEDWKKDILSFVSAIEKEGKNVYELEALSESIFDVEAKATQRVTSYHSEIKKLAAEIQFEDSGLIAPFDIDPKMISQLGYVGR